MEARPFPAPESKPDLRCDICDGPAFELHCKIICRQCGYTRDCGDP